MCAGCGCWAARRLHGRGQFFFVAWLYFWGTFTFDREQSPSLYYHHQKQKSSVVCNPIGWYRQLHKRTVLGQCFHQHNHIASPVIFRLFSIGMCRLTCRHSILICGQICDKTGKWSLLGSLLTEQWSRTRRGTMYPWSIYHSICQHAYYYNINAESAWMRKIRRTCWW